MAFKLTKAEIKERDNLLEVLREKGDELTAAEESFNLALEDLKLEFQPALDAYNGAMVAVQQFVKGIAEDAQSEWDEKSEKWQEGNTGTAAKEWIEAWEALDLEELEIELPEPLDLDLDISDIPGQVEELPEEKDDA